MSSRAYAVAVATLVFGHGAIAQTAAAQAAANPHRIAVFGSSVANGTGDELQREGYTGRLRDLLAPAGWEVVNVSRGGDNTRTMALRFSPPPTGAVANTRYLTPTNAKFVVLALSLGNEGLANVRTKAEKDSVYAQFAAGMKSFVDRTRAAGYVPVIANCYTRGDFTSVEYEYTRRMNLLINSWDVPSVNFLGAVDDGTGKWANGFWSDNLHPTASGHVELFTTFVPSLFEAIEKGKPTPTRSGATGFARVRPGAFAPVTFQPLSVMHPFTVGVTIRARGGGTAIGVLGTVLDTTTVPAPPGRGGAATTRVVTTLQDGKVAGARVEIAGGKWRYVTSQGKVVETNVSADSSWHTVLLTHYAARGETILYVDGARIASAKERLAPRTISIGGPESSYESGPAFGRDVDLRHVLIYRSALNADEVAAIQRGALLQASLEVYAPLADRLFTPQSSAENRAQSMAMLRTPGAQLTHVER